VSFVGLDDAGRSGRGIESSSCEMDSSAFFVFRAPRLVTLGAAALAEFALLPAAEFGLLLADPIYWGVVCRAATAIRCWSYPGYLLATATWKLCLVKT
jgi:hypothetical protein